MRRAVALLLVLGGCASGLFENGGPDAREIDAPGPLPDARVADAPAVDAPIDAPPIDARIDAAVDAPIDGPPIDAPTVEQRLGHVAFLGESSSHSPHFLLGEQVVVPAPTTLRRFGVLVVTSGPQFQMALYSDLGGVPHHLVAQTAPFAVTAGSMEVLPTVPNVILPPGTYWLVGICNQNASFGYTTGAGANVVQYRSLTFGTPLPDPFGGPLMSYTGQSFNYWLVVQ